MRVKNKDLKCVRGDGYIKEEMDWRDISSEAHGLGPTAVPGVQMGVSKSECGSPAPPPLMAQFLNSLLEQAKLEN